MPRLPTGTITFLFTDIEGSTRLLNALGPQAERVVEAHAEILRAALARHGGVEVNTEGDSLFAAFASATDAVLAAADAQRALSDAQSGWPEPVRVRMGIHTGEASLAGRDYIGLEVNRASRIASAAHGGQVLVSEATKVLLADRPGGLRLRDVGEHRLKDLPGRVRLHELVIEGLETNFPPPRSLELTPTNLPQPLTAFFGRQRELAEAGRLLETSRLVTLTGPGGSGKTRVALELAREMLAAFPDGVFFVGLASLREPALVLSAVAREFGLSEGTDLRERLLDRIGSSQTLVILDNFEQLLPAAPTVTDLLTDTPRLKVLVTSRSRLGVYGEHAYAVPPLAVPDPQRLPPVAELGREEAIALFVDRARAARSDFHLTQRNARAVAEIAVHLDGLPLAIELAAARTSLLPPDAIVDRLGDRLKLLSSAAGASDGTDRQRTLRGTIQWSYDLLDVEERTLFSRLGVFLGGAPLRLIISVLRADDEMVVLDQLSSLIDKSLLTRSEAEGELRVDMLETIREFAIDRLGAQDELDKYRERHALAYAALAEEAAPKLGGEEGARWLDLMEREHANLRAAWAWAVEHSRTDIALRLVAATWRFWQMRGHLTEGRERAEQALALPGADTDEARLGRTLEAAGGIAYWMAEWATARDRYQRWLDLTRQSGDRRGEAEALYNISFSYVISREDPEKGRDLAEQALGIYRELGDTAGQAQAVWALGGFENSMPDARPEVARGYFQEAQRLFSQLGNRRMLAWAHFMHARTEVHADRLPEARGALCKALRLFIDLRDLSGYTLGLRGMAVLEWLDGHHENAARLSGASDRLEHTAGVALAAWTSGQWSDAFERAGVEKDPQLANAWTAGKALEPEAAMAEALTSCRDTAEVAEATKAATRRT